MQSEYNFYNSRRISDRKSYKRKVIFSNGSLFFHGKCNNISLGGACIGSRNLLRIEEGMEILISIPYATKKESIKRRAIVKWNDNTRFGIQFFRREKIRKNYHNEITVFINSNIFSAKIKDISLGGARVISENMPTFGRGSEIYVTIPYAKKIGYLTKKAIVRWNDNNHFGFQFI